MSSSCELEGERGGVSGGGSDSDGEGRETVAGFFVESLGGEFGVAGWDGGVEPVEHR